MTLAEQRQIERRLIELETEYNKPSNLQQQSTLKEAFSLCTQNNMPLPVWIANGIEPFIDNPELEKRLQYLEEVYKAGNYGALLDVISLCSGYYRYPLPKWANQALLSVLKRLALGDKTILQEFNNWYKRIQIELKDSMFYEDFHNLRLRDVSCEEAETILAALYACKKDLDHKGGIRPEGYVEFSKDGVKAAIDREEKRLQEFTTEQRRKQLQLPSALRLPYHISNAVPLDSQLLVQIEDTMKSKHIKPRKGKKHKSA